VSLRIEEEETRAYRFALTSRAPWSGRFTFFSSLALSPAERSVGRPSSAVCPAQVEKKGSYLEFANFRNSFQMLA
jgi:hypothetical protein